jgi:hypothetical protein
LNGVAPSSLRNLSFSHLGHTYMHVEDQTPGGKKESIENDTKQSVQRSSKDERVIFEKQKCASVEVCKTLATHKLLV